MNEIIPFLVIKHDNEDKNKTAMYTYEYARDELGKMDETLTQSLKKYYIIFNGISKLQ